MSQFSSVQLLSHVQLFAPFKCLPLSDTGSGLHLFHQTQPESLQLSKWNLIILDMITATDKLIPIIFLCVFLA